MWLGWLEVSANWTTNHKKTHELGWFAAWFVDPVLLKRNKEAIPLARLGASFRFRAQAAGPAFMQEARFVAFQDGGNSFKTRQEAMGAGLGGSPQTKKEPQAGSLLGSDKPWTIMNQGFLVHAHLQWWCITHVLHGIWVIASSVQHEATQTSPTVCSKMLPALSQGPNIISWILKVMFLFINKLAPLSVLNCQVGDKMVV